MLRISSQLGIAPHENEIHIHSDSSPPRVRMPSHADSVRAHQPLHGTTLDAYVDAASAAVRKATHDYEAQVDHGKAPLVAYQDTLLRAFKNEPAARATGIMRLNSSAALDLLRVDPEADKHSGAVIGRHPNDASVDEAPLTVLARNIPSFANRLQRASAYRRLVHTVSSGPGTLEALANVLSSLPIRRQAVELTFLRRRVSELPAHERTPSLLHALAQAQKTLAAGPPSPHEAVKAAPPERKLAVFTECIAHADGSDIAKKNLHSAIEEIRRATRPDAAPGSKALAQFDAKFALQKTEAEKNFASRNPMDLVDHAELADVISKLDEADRYPALLKLLPRTPMLREAYEALAHTIEHMPFRSAEAAKQAIIARLGEEFHLIPDTQSKISEPFLHRSYVAQAQMGVRAPVFGYAKRHLPKHVQSTAPAIEDEPDSPIAMRMRAIKEFDQRLIADHPLESSASNVFDLEPEYAAPLMPIWRGPIMKAKRDSQAHAEAISTAQALCGAEDPEVAAVKNAIRGGPAPSLNEKLAREIAQKKADFQRGLDHKIIGQPAKQRAALQSYVQAITLCFAPKGVA